MTDKRKSLKQRILNYVKYFIKEIIPVTVGILIALSIGNWNQNKKDTKYIGEVFSLIDKELDESLEDIDYKLPLQKSLLDTLEHYSNDKSTSILQIVSKAKGFYAPTLKMNAWRTLANSKIELVDYNKLSKLSNMEQASKILEEKTNRVGDFIVSNANSSDKDKKEFLKILLQDVIGTERTIQTTIKEYKK